MSLITRFQRSPVEPATPDEPRAGSRWRRVAAPATTVLAGLFVLVALVAPADFERFTPGAFLRVPVEGLLGVVLVLVLPPRPRRIAAVVGGAGLGLLLVVKVMDIGFDAVLYRPFDLVLDWPLLGPAVDYVDVTVGRVASIGAVVAVVALVIGLVVLTTRSVLRLTRVVVGHRTASIRAVALLAVASITLAVPGVPISSGGAAEFVYDHARAVKAGLNDREEFAKEAAVDAFRDTPGAELLTGLRGKDVVLTFVESYGRDALENPEIAPKVTAALDAGSAELRAAGYASRSGFLTSPTAGGGSWLAQATLLSGLWIDNQQRYRTLVASDRLSLPSAFGRADWRSVGIMPGITQAWPEGDYFGYDQIRAGGDLGYRGPRFGYATMPDQYTLSAFQQRERSTPGHAPVMAAIPLLSSHAPWSPIPEAVDWDEVGDGSTYNSMVSGTDPPEAIFGRDPSSVRADYAKSVEYSVKTLISYVETYGDDDLVLVFLGDHQPAQVVTGADAGKDVPITIVAKDPAVLDRVAGWGWDDGLKPGEKAPVWRMDEFRDRFLTAFGSTTLKTSASPEH
ncbi:sulfatase [Umezawaea endophytica]|uniref:Sulfatase n=1 Tax=Umezawaea endophytica TaxID=1654476 RepID=A0A9X2VFY1_9PSEU|nr:sulfatase [Umezawaea endophytica]MCS7475938.1 sulfatase [Umezawaea endophytica]